MRQRSFDLFTLLGGEPQNPLIAFANYEAPMLVAPVTTGYKTAGALWAGATARRFQVYEVEFGQTGIAVSTDVSCQWDLSRFTSTTAMVGATIATNLLDPADIASLTLFANNFTTEPPYTTTAGAGPGLKSWAINQRGSYRWRALDDGDNILVPATTANGIGVRTLSAGWNVSSVGNISFIER